MTFEERFNKIIKERSTTKAGLARKLGMHENTMQYKSKRLDAWNVVEFNRMVEELRLTDEEVNFLTVEG